ncbi:hypothetical protein ACFV0T_41075 [Streptomyces sp. NPDC059582]|uniref:hypothetical protein n=1 Tax=Streptomyces sp. NPDC059582 TaxID=3346875 RepID=UPI0036778528
MALAGTTAGQASADPRDDRDYPVGATIIFNNGDGNTTNTQIGNTQGGGIGNTQGGTQVGTGNTQGATQGAGNGNTQGGTQGAGNGNTQGGTQGAGTANTQGGTQGGQNAAARLAAVPALSASAVGFAAVDAAMAGVPRWGSWTAGSYLPIRYASSFSKM